MDDIPRRSLLTVGAGLTAGLPGCTSVVLGNEGVVLDEFSVVNRDTEQNREFHVEIEDADTTLHSSTLEVPKRDTAEWPTRNIEWQPPSEPTDITITIQVDEEEANVNLIDKGYDGSCVRAFSIFSAIEETSILNIYHREQDC